MNVPEVVDALSKKLKVPRLKLYEALAEAGVLDMIGENAAYHETIESLGPLLKKKQRQVFESEGKTFTPAPPPSIVIPTLQSPAKPKTMADPPTEVAPVPMESRMPDNFAGAMCERIDPFDGYPAIPTTVGRPLTCPRCGIGEGTVVGITESDQKLWVAVCVDCGRNANA